MNTNYRNLANHCSSICVIALMLHSAPALARDNEKPLTAWEASRADNDSDMVTTGVARARDRLDSATSTSSLKENEIAKLAPRSLDDLFRNIPGIRVEGGSGEGMNAYTVRGLPLVNGGAKYLQIQEDGLPVLEFGDLANMGPDVFVRADLNVASVDSIRGGSASTFASNAPGGVINLISKTGEVEGGSVQLSSGLNYGSNRADFDYGTRLNDTWRFHIGGFYRAGEGPRKTGYNATQGGQIKFNLTKQFAGGSIRFYGKFLDDKFPGYIAGPMTVSGTDAKPTYGNLPQFNSVTDTAMSRYISNMNQVDAFGNIVSTNAQDGYRVSAKSVGTEVQFGLGGWSFTERFRYSDMSGQSDIVDPQLQLNAPFVLLGVIAPGGTATYATGPNAGHVINPLTVSGNGLVALSTIGHTKINSLRNFTNDFRASKVWQIGGGDLTTTAGVYKSLQKLDREYFGSVVIQDIVGNGNSALINVQDPSGAYMFRNGVLQYNDALNPNRHVNVDYDVLAPYGSFNFHKGKVAIGGSVRYDRGRVTGSIAQANASQNVDVDRNGILDMAERGFANGVAIGIPFISPSASQPVDYRYGYASYSVGINYRMAESLALFARHSLGGRAGADALLFSPAISARTGALLNKDAGHDSVRQSEVGVKFRRNGITLNLTGFYATTRGTFLPNLPDAFGLKTPTLVSRSYRTFGAEFEGSVHHGPFSLAGSATLTGGEITADAPAFSNTLFPVANPIKLVGKTPRRQPTLLYTLTPQYDSDRFTVGANVGGQTSSYADDSDMLKMPGFTTVGLFAQYRPVDRLSLGVNVSNVFNTTAIQEVNATTIPLNGVATARTVYGRLVSASARFFF